MGSFNIYTIIVTYNGSAWIQKCLESLLSATMTTNILVLDNHSSDNTIELVKQYEEVDLMLLDSNLGFGKANNIGIRKALDERADFVFLVNQDVYVATDALELLLRQYRASCGQGVLSPVHLAPDGSLDYSFADHVKRYVSPVHHNLIDDRGDCMIETDFVNAACWLIPAEVLRKVGVFNPVFPHYGEDNDFVNRLHYHGFKAYINPASIITHDRHQGERKKSIKELKKREYISFIKHYLNINLAEQEAMQVVMTKLRKESLYYFLTGSISKLRGLIAGYGQYKNQKPELRKYREYSQQEGAYI